MLALNSGDKLQGDASVAAVIDYTIHGVRNTTIMQLADGQLPIVTGDIYEATGIIAVSSIIIINTDANTRTINLFLLPNGGVARRICPKDLSLQAGYSALIEGGKMQVFDTNGALQTSQTGGDVTGPAVAVDSNMAEFDGITGKIIKDSLLTHADVKDAVDKKHTEAHGTNHTDGTDDVATMSGDAGAGGTKGLVPAQAAGDTLANKFLRADATWAAIPKTSTSDTDPTVNDDIDQGYIPGSVWVNNATNVVHQCIDNSNGAAVWARMVRGPAANTLSYIPQWGAANSNTLVDGIEKSTDGTLGDNSDNAVPTEKAVKTYVDGEVQKAEVSVPYNDADGKVLIATVPAGSIIEYIAKRKPNGVATFAYDVGTVTIGTDADPDLLMTSVMVDPTGATAKAHRPSADDTGSIDAETAIYAFIAGGPTVGNIIIVMRYI